MYRNRGIHNVVHSPVSDYFENEYCEQLFKASLILNELVNIKKLNVFCHCSAGISRGPTLFLCYLALFMKHPQWNNINELYSYIKHFYPFANPNLKVVKRVLEENKDFIDK
jgi:protein-tyrosine phosphatase